MEHFLSQRCFLERGIVDFLGFRFIRHVSTCQPPTVCICVHLANSREKDFFFSPTSVHFLAVLKQIFEQLLFLLIAIV